MASQIKIMRAAGDKVQIKTTADKVVRKNDDGKH